MLASVRLMPDAASSTRSPWTDPLLAIGLIAGLVVLLSLDVTTPAQPAEALSQTDTWLRVIVEYLAAAAELAAAAVIGIAVVRGVINYLRRFLSPGAPHVDATERIRLQLGRTLALGLEFALASDILRTAVAPSRQDILTLGAIILLRTLLNLFLEREIRSGEARRHEADGGTGMVRE